MTTFRGQEKQAYVKMEESTSHFVLLFFKVKRVINKKKGVSFLKQIQYPLNKLKFQKSMP